MRGRHERVGQIATRMEPVLEQARRAGILIIHLPSDTMSFDLENTPARLLAENAPHLTPPPDLKIPDGALPIDDSDGGCDTPGDKEHKAWTREIATLIASKDEPSGGVAEGNEGRVSAASQFHHLGYDADAVRRLDGVEEKTRLAADIEHASSGLDDVPQNAADSIVEIAVATDPAVPDQSEPRLVPTDLLPPGFQSCQHPRAVQDEVGSGRSP